MSLRTVIVACFLYISGCSTGYGPEARGGLNPYRVGVNRSAKSYLDRDGRLTGIYVEVFRVAAARTGLPYEFVWLDNQSLDRAFAERRLDIHVAVAVTPSRLHGRFYMAEPWWETPLIAIVGQQSPFKITPDLSGKTVAVMRAAEGFWDQLFAPSLPGAKRLDVAPPANAIEMLCAGTVSAVLMVGTDAETILANHPAACRDTGFRFLRVPMVKAKYSLAVQPDLRAVGDRLNHEIQNMAVDGALSAAVAPFLGLNSAPSDYLTQAVTASRRLTMNRAIAAVASGALILIFLCVLLWRERRARRRVAAALAEAQRASQVKCQFLTMVSHEMRTPVNGILGMAEVMLTKPMDEEQREAARTIRRSSEALVTVLSDILDMSQLEAGRMTIVRERFSVQPLLEDIVRLMEALAREKQIGLYLEIAQDTPEWMVGDAVRLRQILLNLVGNAVKFTEAGFVELSARLEEPAPAETGEPMRLRFTVRDSGPGIPTEQIPFLFEKFTQLDSGPGRRHGGVGLGLAIAKGLAESMGGSITMHSELERGSTVWVSVPLGLGVWEAGALTGQRKAFAGTASAGNRRPGRMLEGNGLDSPEESARKTAGEPAMPSNARGAEHSSADLFTGKRVLVVEDNAVNRKVLTTLLGSLGCVVLEAADGGRAVESWRTNRPDLVMMDCQMPGIDGFAATRMIRAEEANGASGERCPIFAVTANVMADDQANCRAAGMDGVIAKPFTRAQLAKKLREAFPASES